jgi:hypothetical protein
LEKSPGPDVRAACTRSEVFGSGVSGGRFVFAGARAARFRAGRAALVVFRFATWGLYRAGPGGA